MTNLILIDSEFKKVIKPKSVTCIGRTGVRNYAGRDTCKFILQLKNLASGDLHGRKT